MIAGWQRLSLVSRCALVRLDAKGLRPVAQAEPLE